MAWDNQYRMLNKGEIIMEGDEVDTCRDGWRDEPKWQPAKECIGQPAPDPAYPSHRVYRRKWRRNVRSLSDLILAIRDDVMNQISGSEESEQWDRWLSGIGARLSDLACTAQAGAADGKCNESECPYFGKTKASSCLCARRAV